MDKTKTKDQKLRDKIFEFIELLENKDALNQDLVNRNRMLKTELYSHLSIKNEFEEGELSLIIGLELLLLIKRHKYSQLKEDAQWNLLYDAINVLYGDISDIVASVGLTSQEIKVCYLTYIGLSNSEQAKILIVEPYTIKKYKNRIRNKLNLDEQIHLSVHLSLLSKQNKR